MIIRTTRTIIRPWDFKDVSDLVRYANNQSIGTHLRDGFPYPYTELDARQFIKMALEKSPASLFAIEMGHEAIGSVGYFRKENVYSLNAEIGYWLGEPFWGKGIMTEVLIVLTDEIFRTTDLIRLSAHTFELNPKSGRVLEKAGYTKEAVLKNAVKKHGIIQDEIIYTRLRSI